MGLFICFAVCQRQPETPKRVFRLPFYVRFSGCLLRLVIRRLFQPQPHGFAFDKIGIAFKAAALADNAVVALLDVAVVLVAGGLGLALACVGEFGVQVFQTAFGYGGMGFALFDELQDAFEVAG